MKVIKFNIDLRLNPQDKYAVLSPAFLPYSEANMEYARELSVDGVLSIDEFADVDAPPTNTDRITELEEALALLLSGVTE